MSKSELLHAYMDGRIGRREFIRGLVGTGMALTAASAHAAALKPVVAQSGGDFYNPRQSRRVCIQNAAANLESDRDYCRNNLRGRRRTECMRNASVRWRQARAAC
jgi:hypothetical protein